MSAFILIPTIDLLDYLEPCLQDCLGQEGVDPQILVISNGSTSATRERLELLQEANPKILVWSHNPPLPSLAASWNAGLRFAWACGATECLVVNDDTRIPATCYAILRWVQHATDALFVSAVGVRPEQYDPEYAPIAQTLLANKGGPDFSCLLVTKAGHEAYPYDEGFLPAYFEDNDLVRRMWLGGDGARIFSVNLPYAHIGSRTINRSKDAFKKFNRRFEQVRQRYVAKWGGLPHHETFLRPFDLTSARDQVGTPGGYITDDAPLRDAVCTPTPDSPTRS